MTAIGRRKCRPQHHHNSDCLWQTIRRSVCQRCRYLRYALLPRSAQLNDHSLLKSISGLKPFPIWNYSCWKTLAEAKVVRQHERIPHRNVSNSEILATKIWLAVERCLNSPKSRQKPLAIVLGSLR